MNDRPHTASDEHKTTASYVVGFILSLVFTFIPYYLVVNHVVSGMTLLLTILGFAVIQMIIQIVFFLHLGRGPKPFYNVVFFIATVGIILVVVGGSIIIINNLHHNMSPSDQTKRLINSEGIYQISGEKTGACQGHGINHTVTIRDGQFVPARTLANTCDTLNFINADKVTREIAFGPTHERHQPYAGLTKVTIRKGMGKTITLSEPGTYQFHDHLGRKSIGTFTVVP